MCVCRLEIKLFFIISLSSTQVCAYTLIKNVSYPLDYPPSIMIKPFLKFFSRIFRAADEPPVDVIIPAKVMSRLQDYIQLSPDKAKWVEVSKLFMDGTYRLIGIELIHAAHTIGRGGKHYYDRLKLVYTDKNDDEIHYDLLSPLSPLEPTAIVCIAYNDILGVIEDYLEQSIEEFTFGTFGYIDL